MVRKRILEAKGGLSLSGSVPGSATVTTVAEAAAVGRVQAAVESEWRKGLRGLNWPLGLAPSHSGSLGCWDCQWWAGFGEDPHSPSPPPTPPPPGPPRPLALSSGPSLALAPLGLGHQPPHPDPTSAAAASPTPGPGPGCHGALPSPAVITDGQKKVWASGQAWAPWLLGLTSWPCPQSLPHLQKCADPLQVWRLPSLQQLPDAMVLIQGHLKQVPLQHELLQGGPGCLRQLQHGASQLWQQRGQQLQVWGRCGDRLG